MTKYEEQFKLSVVQSYVQGTEGVKSIAQRYGLAPVVVESWVSAYREHGLSGLCKKFNHHSAEFKLSVLHRMQQEKLQALLQAKEQAAPKKRR